MSKRLTLSEDDINIDDIALVLPEDDDSIDVIKDRVNPMDVIPQEEQDALAGGEVHYDENGNVIPKPEVVVNAYTDMLQDLLRKQWDVINAADSIIATVDSEQSELEVNKQDIKAILNKLVEDTTIAIGMVTKALGVVDPSQEELMNRGVEKAEEVISEEQPVNESLNEDLSDELDFSNLNYFERYWCEEAAYWIEYMLDDYEENPENYDDDDPEYILSMLDNTELKSICESVSNSIRNNDYLWEHISDVIRDCVRDDAYAYKDTVTKLVDLNSEGDGTQGE